MDEPIRVKKIVPKYKSLDYQGLREEGIKLTQELSGAIWTDYNPHDPGLTILEQLCYALTDLGYRTDFKIQDLLNARTRKRRKELNNTFYDSSEALPTTPVSLADYRILIIDRLNGDVKNAWVEVVRDNLQGVQGLYRVYLQVDDSARAPKKLQAIEQQVFEIFADNRNLCEELDSVHILDVEKIVITADLDISSDVVAEEALANILFKLEEHLNPTIKFHTLEGLLDEGYSVDEVFDGPAPVHGFIKKEDLLPLKKEVYISKLIEIISGTEGVRRINYFEVRKNDLVIEGDVIQIRDQMYPVLEMDLMNEKYVESNKYPIKFYRGALKYDLDLNMANQLYYSLYASYRKGYQPKMLYHERDYPSVLKQEEISKYYSIQDFFPINYGINRFGLPSNVRPTRERLAMVKQLKGYLLFFEQIMANYLAQLANIKSIFSIDETIDRSYFSQVPTDIPQLGDLMKSRYHKIEEKTEEFNQKVEALVKQFDPFIDRRNRALDHLLARFGEQFITDFLPKMESSAGDHDDDPEMDLIRAKIEFLKNWKEISKNRGRGFNYLKGIEDAWNVSGLEKRSCLFLHIAQSGNESLLRVFLGEIEGTELFDDIIEIVSSEITEGIIDLAKLQQDELERASKEIEKNKQEQQDSQLDFMEDLMGDEDDVGNNEVSQSPQDDSSEEDTKIDESAETIDYTQRFVFRSKDKKLGILIQGLLLHGVMSHNYVILPIKGKDSFSIYYKGDRDLGVYKVREVTTRLAARVEVEKLIKYLQKVNHYSEGMHVVEHMLLRPQAKDKYGFRLVNDQKKVLLTCYQLGDMEDQKQICARLDELGAKAENYIIEEMRNESFRVVLCDEEKKRMAVSPEEFYSEEGAKDKIQDIADYVQSFIDGRIPIDNNISFFAEQRKEASAENKFYNLNVSVVLPKWPTRFQNEDFQKLLKSTFGLNVPVHIALNFYWLDFDEMEHFEKSYFGWLKERVSPEPEQPKLDEQALEVIELLLQYEKKLLAMEE